MTIQALKKVDIDKVSNPETKKAILAILEDDGYKEGSLNDEDMNEIYGKTIELLLKEVEQQKAKEKTESKPKETEKKPEKTESKPKETEKKPEKTESKPKETETIDDEVLGCEKIIKEYRAKQKEKKIKSLVEKAKEMRIAQTKIDEAKENINELRVLVGEIEKPSKSSKTETGVKYIINENAGVTLQKIKGDKKEEVEKIKEVYTQKIASVAKQLVEEMKKEINKLLAA